MNIKYISLKQFRTKFLNNLLNRYCCPRIRPLAGHAERLQVRHHQRALQDGHGQGQLPRDQEQVLGQAIQASRTSKETTTCYKQFTR